MIINNFQKLPKNWQVKTLAEVCTSKNSNIVLSSIENNIGKYPIYGAKGLLKTIDFYTIENESLGIVKDGAVGKIFLLPPKSSVIGTMAYIQANENLNLKYLYYFLHTINFNQYISGSVIPHIYFRDYKKEKIPLPPLEIQQKIVAKLESEFAKIEAAKSHLEKVKETIPRLKNSLLKSAFSGKLTESNLLSLQGEAEAIHNTESLPQGWEIKTLGEIGKVVSGGTPSTINKDNFDGEIAWITPADLSGYKEKYISKGKRNLSEQGLKNSSARLLPPNSILFSSRAPIGYVAIASNTLCTNQWFKNLIPHSNVSSEYIYYFLLHSKRLAESVASGTTFKEISATNFSKLPIPLPPLETQKQIVEILDSKFTTLENLEKETNASLEKLHKLKSSLLNLAFKGELIC